MTERIKNKDARALDPRVGALIVFLVMVMTGIALISTQSEQETERATPHQVVALGLDESLGALADAPTSLESPGAKESALALAYQPQEARFHLVVHQVMTLKGDDLDTEVTTSIDAKLHLVPSEEDSSLTFLSFEDFEVEVRSEGELVELPAVSSLLAGIRVQIALDPKLGLGEDTTIAGVNPQVKRMISLLVDAIRQAHLPLPKEPVGPGATWSRAAEWGDDASSLTATTSQEITLLKVEEGGASLRAEVVIEVDGEAEGTEVAGSGAGTLTATFDPSEGKILNGQGNLTYEQKLEGVTQVLSLRYELSHE